MSNFSHGESVVPDSCQCHSDRQLIEKKKSKNKKQTWLLGTSD